MPLKAELDTVKKAYVKLMKLPVKDLLPALKAVCSCVNVLYALFCCYYGNHSITTTPIHFNQ